MKLQKSFLLFAFVLVGFGGVFTSDLITAQDTSKKAVMAFTVDYDSLMKSKMMELIGGVEGFAKLTEMDAEAADIMQNLSSLEGYFTAPKSIDPSVLVQTEFLLILTMKKESIVDQMMDEMSNGFVEVERNGKTVLKAEGVGAPPIFARQDGKQLVIASESGLFRKPESFVGDDLKKLFAKHQGTPLRVVANFDGARDFLTELSTTAGANADFMTKQYIKLLDQISTVEIAGLPNDKTLYMVRLIGHNEKDNKKIKLSVDAAVGLLKGLAEIGLASMKDEAPEVAELAEAMLGELKVEGGEKETVVNLSMPANFAEMWLKAMKSAQGQAKKVSDLNLMKQSALSMHNYYDTYRKFPFHETVTTNLNWRVHVLPYVEEGQLFRKFDLDEKWSSERNRKMIGSCPKVFRFSNGSIISFIKPEKVPGGFGDILDGSSNTLALIEDRTAKMTPWTKPTGVTPDQVVKMVKDLKDGDSLVVAFYDGSVTRISNETSEETLRRLCDPQDGKVVDHESIK